MAAVAAALRGEEVAYVDTTASFSGQRAAGTYHLLKPGLQVTMTATAQIAANLIAASGASARLARTCCIQASLRNC